MPISKNVYNVFDENVFYLDQSFGEYSEYFITLSEYREQRINEILND